VLALGDSRRTAARGLPTAHAASWASPRVLAAALHACDAATAAAAAAAAEATTAEAGPAAGTEAAPNAPLAADDGSGKAQKVTAAETAAVAESALWLRRQLAAHSGISLVK
jgi:hypothetical protein